MIVLMRAWSNNPGGETVDWAVLSLNQDMVDLCLLRIEQAKQMWENSPCYFYGVQYRCGWPVWVGYCELWEDIYTKAAEVIPDGLAPANHDYVSTDCTMMLVTAEGVEWSTTVADGPSKAETAVLSRPKLEKMLYHLQQKE